MDDPEESETTPDAESTVDQITELAVAVSTGIPPQIQRNLFKAAGTLIGAVSGVGKTWFEGKAKLIKARQAVEIARADASVSAIKAEQKANNLLTQRRAEVVAKQLEHVSLDDRAAAYRDASNVRAQANREEVLQFALEKLQDQDNPPDANEEIDTDWISFFYQEAGRRSADEFKHLFGRILAGEIVSPGSFSIGTLQSLSRITAQTALIFQRFCNVRV
jgi:hypothetical protein